MVFQVKMENSHYAGSQIFSWLADYTKLPVDQVNFIIGQIAALGLATLFRTVLHPSKTTPAVRHAFGLIFGLLTGYFCFGFQAIHLASLPALCYVIIITQNPHIVHGMVLTVSLIYLSCLHLHRQIYDYGSYGLDITGPLMVITQKVTSLAFSLHDGLTKNESDMTQTQKQFAITHTPGPLEYFSFTLLFPGIMAGPVIFYKDYVEFIEGTNYTSNQKGNNKPPNVLEPSPVGAVCRKVALAVVCAIIFVMFLPMFPISRVKDPNFLENTTIVYKFWYLSVCTTLVRFKYYFAWTLADAICNNCGIGFNGYKEDGSPKWDGITNVDILKFELAKSLKESIEAWNLGTNRWLRMLVYDRTKKYSTVLTYALSAVWHGFYPGYYLTFFSGALFTFAARTVRKSIRDYFMESFAAKFIYDVITFIATRLVLAYITFTFVLLEFAASVRLYNKMFWGLHMAAVLVLLLLPRISSRDLSSKNCSLAQVLKRAGPYSNRVGNND